MCPEAVIIMTIRYQKLFFSKIKYNWYCINNIGISAVRMSLLSLTNDYGHRRRKSSNDKCHSRHLRKIGVYQSLHQDLRQCPPLEVDGLQKIFLGLQKGV